MNSKSLKMKMSMCKRFFEENSPQITFPNSKPKVKKTSKKSSKNTIVKPKISPKSVVSANLKEDDSALSISKILKKII